MRIAEIFGQATLPVGVTGKIVLTRNSADFLGPGSGFWWPKEAEIENVHDLLQIEARREDGVKVHLPSGWTTILPSSFLS